MTRYRFRQTGHAAVVSGRGPPGAGFSLLELLVVVGIITLLISTLLPSLRNGVRQAAATVCMHNLRQIGQAIDFYKLDNNGWGPITDRTEHGAEAGSPVSVWFHKLVTGDYVSDPAVFVCPEDPLRPWLLGNRAFGAHTTRSFACSYGMNEFILASSAQFRCNLDRVRPKRPHNTLLVADMGPDVMFAGSAGGHMLTGPSRRNGSLPWDDGYVPGEPDNQEPWITARHLGGMNVLMHAGGVQRVATRVLMSKDIMAYYDACAAGSCTLCAQTVEHYSFAASQTFWWTGPVPTP